MWNCLHYFSITVLLHHWHQYFMLLYVEMTWNSTASDRVNYPNRFCVTAFQCIYNLFILNLGLFNFCMLQKAHFELFIVCLKPAWVKKPVTCKNGPWIILNLECLSREFSGTCGSWLNKFAGCNAHMIITLNFHWVLHLSLFSPMTLTLGRATNSTYTKITFKHSKVTWSHSFILSCQFHAVIPVQNADKS